MPPTRTGTLASLSASATFQASEPPEITPLSLRSLDDLECVEDFDLLLGVEDHRLLALGVRKECLEPGIGRRGSLAAVACLGDDLVVGDGLLEKLLDLVETFLPPLASLVRRLGAAGALAGPSGPSGPA